MRRLLASLALALAAACVCVACEGFDWAPEPKPEPGEPFCEVARCPQACDADRGVCRAYTPAEMEVARGR